VLLAVNGLPIQSPSDVIEYQHRGHAGTRLVYTLLRIRYPAADRPCARAGAARQLDVLSCSPRLACSLCSSAPRSACGGPRDQATLHFFWLCVAFFGVFTFSFNGPFDRLDWAFYWGDAIAFALLPPLLLHFTMVFPARPGDGRRTTNVERLHALLVPLMYAPALVLGAARVIAVTRVSQGSLSGPLFSRVLEWLDRSEPVYLFVYAAAALGRAGPRLP
jgi:hypothetical protein